MLQAAIAADAQDDAIMLSKFNRQPVFDLLADRSAAERERFLAARAIGAAKLGGGWEVLKEMLLDRDTPSELRCECARMLGWMRKPSNAEALLQVLGESDEALLRTAVDALGRIGNPLAFNGLLALWDRTAGDFRVELVENLRRVCDLDAMGFEAELDITRHAKNYKRFCDRRRPCISNGRSMRRSFVTYPPRDRLKRQPIACGYS